MRRRPVPSFRPDVERFEEKALLSAAVTSAVHAAHAARATHSPGYLAYRITNPTNGMVNLTPPFQHVLVQKAQPVPGEVYNVLFVAVKNQTNQTFTASDGFTVRVTSGTGAPGSAGRAFPVLTGDQVWKPNTWMVFYIFSKKYYGLSPEVSAGFQLDAGGRSSTMVPGPSGDFLRLPYHPATFDKTLDWIVAYGPGAEGGAGAKLGLPDTAINALVSAKTDRQDFAGHF